jgi:peptide-methionine (S)-S-oxide reductase
VLDRVFFLFFFRLERKLFMKRCILGPMLLAPMLVAQAAAFIASGHSASVACLPGSLHRSFCSRQAPSFGRPLTMAAAATKGDLVEVNWLCTTDDGKDLPIEAQVFDQGRVRLVVGQGGFLPCLHSKVIGMNEGDKATFDIPPAEAFGESNPMMGPVDIPTPSAPPGLKEGVIVQLSNGAKARVTRVTTESITIDANAPLAGVALKLNIELLAVQAGAKSLQLADFALGCFWGAELAFQREPGVIATKVGYTQGKKSNPTYEEVCSGTTGHTECVQVMYDPQQVSYERLCQLFWKRLGESRYLLNQVGNDRGTQYRHGIYWHTPEQKAVAEMSLKALSVPGSQRIATEVMEVFYVLS